MLYGPEDVLAFSVCMEVCVLKLCDVWLSVCLCDVWLSVCRVDMYPGCPGLAG